MSAVERIRHELREIGLVTLYFLAFFLFFLSLKRLLLEEYEVKVAVLGTAVVGALVVAKVVVILDKTPLGEWFRSERVFLYVLSRSLVYTAIVFAVTCAEHLFDLYRETDDLGTALSQAWAGRDVHHFLALNLSVGVAFLVYNTFREIERHLGDGGLRSLFFGRRKGADA